MNWEFSVAAECEVFKVHVGRGDAGDVLEVRVHGEDQGDGTVLRDNYSTMAHGSARYTPPFQPSFVLDAPGAFGPWGAINVAESGNWHCEMLEAGSVYVCLTSQPGHKLDYLQIRSAVEVQTYVTPPETWAVPIGGPATINGITIPEFAIAHKADGDMLISNIAELVVCLTERNNG